MPPVTDEVEIGKELELGEIQPSARSTPTPEQQQQQEVGSFVRKVYFKGGKHYSMGEG